MKKLPKKLGTIDDSRRAAAIMAIKENDTVEYEFNDAFFTISPEEAKGEILQFTSNSIRNLEGIRNEFETRFDARMMELKEEFEILKLLCKES
jgi:hypothetical protein